MKYCIRKNVAKSGNSINIFMGDVLTKAEISLGDIVHVSVSEENEITIKKVEL